MTSNVLQEVFRARLKRLEYEKRTTPLETLEAAASSLTPALDFAGVFAHSSANIIAEVKRASPSRGVLREGLSPGALAAAYQRAGACAVSVLTEPDYFHGSLGDLKHVRSSVSLPVLRKDFISDPYQVVEARAAGADSFLLIVAMLETETLKSLIDLGRKWGMGALVEVHNERELEAAQECGAKIIGINNRDLVSLRVDLDVTLRLAPQISDDRIIVSESGIKTRADITRLSAAGARGFLIGEGLVTAADPEAKLKELLDGNH